MNNTTKGALNRAMKIMKALDKQEYYLKINYYSVEVHVRANTLYLQNFIDSTDGVMSIVSTNDPNWPIKIIV